MKVFLLTLSSLWTCAAAAASLATDTRASSFQPRRISFQALRNGDGLSHADLLEALSVDGIISISDIPELDGFKQDVMANMHDCALVSKETKAHTFADGTRRLTMATHTVPGPGGQQALVHGSDCQSCRRFEEASTSFRRTVDVVTQLFAERLNEALNVLDGPLLETEQKYAFQSLRDVIAAGEHLEHFHSYQKTSENDLNAADTIDMHTDQGLFLVFSPGHMVSSEDSRLSSGFFVQKADGTMAQVSFTPQDEIVILLGDGVNQYVNSHLPDSQKLRAVPHSLRMPVHEPEQARVWYGRMVLPPSDAIHPVHQITFGELRSRMIDASYDVSGTDSESLALGCSGTRIARELSANVTCATDELYCWHQCMELDDYNVTEASCLAQDLMLACINPRLQLSNGTLHGDYFPGCVASDAEMETPIPTLPNYPRDEDLCTVERFLRTVNEEEYDYTATLLEDVAMFRWSITNDNMLSARLYFNGLFGWIAFGFADLDGDKNGMHGAKIIMGLPGGNYSGLTGLDLSTGGSLATYEIDDDLTPFRYWASTEEELLFPGNNSGIQRLSSDSCVTTMGVVTDNIRNQTFNLTGTDQLLWAANGEDSFVMYHGNNRGRFSIRWSDGSVQFLSQALPDEGDGSTNGDTTAGNGTGGDTSADELSAAANHGVSFICLVALLVGSKISLWS